MVTMYWMRTFYRSISLAMNNATALRNRLIQFVIKPVDCPMFRHAMPDVNFTKQTKILNAHVLKVI